MDRFSGYSKLKEKYPDISCIPTYLMIKICMNGQGSRG